MKNYFVAWIAKNASESDHNKLCTSNMKPRYIGQWLYWKKLIEVLGLLRAVKILNQQGVWCLDVHMVVKLNVIMSYIQLIGINYMILYML